MKWASSASRQANLGRQRSKTGPPQVLGMSEALHDGSCSPLVEDTVLKQWRTGTTAVSATEFRCRKMTFIDFLRLKCTFSSPT